MQIKYQVREGQYGMGVFAEEDIKKGTLVLLVDEIKHRSDWRMGRVVDTFGDESHVRTVTVRVASGKVFRRDITKVVNLVLGGAPE